MENQEHTPTPWRISKSGYRYVHGVGEVESIYAPDGTGILAFVFRKENTECNARRIVACVNFCEGEPIRNLEDNDLNGLLKRDEAKIKQMRAQITEQQAELDRLRQQNAKLVEVLENLIVEYQASYSFEDVESVEEIKAARAAIAEAEKE